MPMLAAHRALERRGAEDGLQHLLDLSLHARFGEIDHDIDMDIAIPGIQLILFRVACLHGVWN